MTQASKTMETLRNSELLTTFTTWFREFAYTSETLLEVILLGVTAAAAWLLSRQILVAIVVLQERHARYAALGRLWATLARVSFLLVWAVCQWLLVAVLAAADMQHTVLVVVSSLLTAWIVIRLATAFVANPILARTIALVAWIVAALNILGLLEYTLAVMRDASFTLGQFTISALTVVKAIVALAILLWITALIAQLIEVRIKASENLTPSIKVLTAKLMRIGLAVIAFVFALTIVGIDLTAFAVVGGAIGVGLGFGLQKIFANLVSGFILLLDKSIKPGDVIAVNESFGRVDSLGARYVSVLTLDGIEHLIPNEDLITTRVENWSHSSSFLRLRKTVGIHYKSDVRQAIALCMQALDETPRVLKEPKPVCLLQDFADSSVNLEILFWINDPMSGTGNVTSAVMLNVWDKFHEHGIEIPYPQRDLHFRSSEISAAHSERLKEDS